MKNFLLLGVSIAFALILGEMADRIAHGYKLTHFALASKYDTTSVSNDDHLDQSAALDAMLAHIPLAAGVNRDWFYQSPPALSNRTPQPNAELTWRNKVAGTGFESGHVFNLDYVIKEICHQNRHYYSYYKELHELNNIYVFKDKSGSLHPFYHLLKGTTFPSGFVTNQFGFRGPEIPFEKPPRTIRIAFLGASTTEGQGYNPHAYPEYVGYWLNRWAQANHLNIRFDIINVGGSGYHSADIAARFTQDVLPLQPDIAIYYEGANEFSPSVGDYVKYANEVAPLVAPRTSLVINWFSQYSTLFSDTQLAFDKIFRANAKEPIKPPYIVQWPATVNEHNPNLAAAALPKDIKEILHSLDNILHHAEQNHIILIPTSFVWYVYRGLILHLPQDAEIYSHLNTSLWPLSYEWIHRYALFQNTIYRKYASVHHLNFIDIDSYYPRNDHLFFDAVHGTLAGTRMLAWIETQQLIPLIKAQMAAGHLPRAWQPAKPPKNYFNNKNNFKITKNEVNTLCMKINGVGIINNPTFFQRIMKKIHNHFNSV